MANEHKKEERGFYKKKRFHLLSLLLLLSTPIRANNIDDLLNSADMNFRLGNNDIACTFVSMAIQQEKSNPELASYAKRCDLRYNIKAKGPYYMY